MWSRLVAVIALLAIGAPVGLSQGMFNNSGNLSVRVTYADGRHFTDPVRVQLMDGSGIDAVSTTYTNDAGMAAFEGIKVGLYHVVVSGDIIETADSGQVEIDTRKVSQFVYITVTPKADQNATHPGAGPSISAADLNIPENARKEFDKASEYIAKQNWNKAIDRLKKAIEIYPKYANAYNNLAVAYGHMGDRAAERSALEQAIGLNDRLAAAYVNLAKMDITDHRFPEAEGLLGHATTADPTDAKSLVLLANVQLLDNHFDDAIANCRKVHSMAPSAHALVHYIAARAFEHQNRPNDAFSELQTFLKEESDGPRAEAVRKEMGQLQAYLH
jgi:lipopolysaccharide biosynthesis regulator YciM